MPVALFPDGLEPADPRAVICRFLTLRKFEDLVESRELFFNRADRFPQDEKEGLPPARYAHFRNLHPLDINDRRTLSHDTATTAQFREGFYISCWHLFDEEKSKTWRLYGEDGVAIFSRYDLLKSALDSMSDKALLGLVRYGDKHLTGWNILRFITTKHEDFKDDNEVRALLWLPDDYAGINRHFDENNYPHERPLTPPPPDRVKDFHRRAVDLQSLVTEVVVSPFAPTGTTDVVARLIADAGLAIPSRQSDLAKFLGTLVLP